MVKIGIIGGSGLDDPELIKNPKRIRIRTRYGKPSSPLTCGKLKGVEVAILARHGKKHSIWPTGVNFRANIKAFQKVGCTHIIATTAVGSLRTKIKPGDFVFPDQFIDFTKHRDLTFHKKEVVHTSMSDPFCGYLCGLLHKSAKRLKLRCHGNSTVLTIEGPRFSTKAESEMFKLLGGDIINMSTVPEVTLAREAKMCYATIAMSTDYDSWKKDEEPVTWDIIVKRMKQNAHNVKKLILEVIPQVKNLNCECKK